MARIGWQNRMASVNLRRLEIAIEAALSVSPSLLAVLGSNPPGWTTPGRSCEGCNEYVAVKVNCVKLLSSAKKMRAGQLYTYVSLVRIHSVLVLIHSEVQTLQTEVQHSSVP
jgi:hypothetical protein